MASLARCPECGEQQTSQRPACHVCGAPLPGQAADTARPLPLVVAITGASGAIYAIRLLNILSEIARPTHLVVSRAAVEVIQQELPDFPATDNFRESLRNQLGICSPQQGGWLIEEDISNWNSGIASGSYLTAGMVICPCSMNTVASIAHGLSSNLILRAAGVHLKERRKLILVPRETPLSTIQLENLTACSRAGALVLPAMPGWYHEPQSTDDLVDFVVGRICDQLGIARDLTRRWGGVS